MRLTIATTLLLGLLAAPAESATAVTALVKTEAAMAMDTAAGDEATKIAEALTSADDKVTTTPAVTEATAKIDNKLDNKLNNKSESEIPLNLDAPKKVSEESHPLFKMILALSMMGVVGTGAYIFMRKYSKNNFAAGKNNQIKVLTQHYLGPKKSLAIIRVAGESILIGITDQNISMLKSLALLDDEVPEEVHSSDFADLFASVPQGSTPRTQSAEASAKAEEEEEEEFSIRGVKDVVSKKLKGMRSFQ